MERGCNCTPKISVSGGSQGENGKIVEVKNTTGKMRKGLTEWTISKFRLEIKSNHVTGLISFCYLICGGTKNIAIWEPVFYLE